MENKAGKLIKVGKTDVKSALGFFWSDGYKIYVAATKEDIQEWEKRGRDCYLFPMEYLEQKFRKSEALRFISWCKEGCIVRQGAHQVTFEYTTHKSVIHIK